MAVFSHPASNSGIMKSKDKTLFRVGISALVVRALYLFAHLSSPFFARPFLDQKYYELCARQIAGMGGNVIDGFRPLLYPFVLSVFYLLDPDNGELLSLIAQHTMGIAMAVMVAWLAMHLFDSKRAGLIAGLLFAFSAPPLYFEGELLIATFFSFLLLVLWISICKALENPVPWRAGSLWIISGMILGLAAQARPNALALLLFFPMVFLFRLMRRKISFSPLIGLLGLLVVQLAFAAINSHFSGRFTILTQAGGINFYLGNSKKADGMIPRQDRYVVYEGSYQDPIQAMAIQGYEEAGHEMPATPERVSAYWKTRTLEEIRQAPAQWIRLMIKKSWLMLWNHEIPNNRSFSFVAEEETPLLQWIPVRWWLLLSLAPWGLAALYRMGKHEMLLWMVSFFVLLSGTIILFFVNSRFRIPLWPGMAILSGGGAIHLWSQLKTGKRPWVLAACSIALLLISCVNWFGIPPDPVEIDHALRSKAYLEIGRPKEALADIEKSLATTQNNPGYHQHHGNILLALNENLAAVEAYHKALTLNPGNPMVHNNVGVAFEQAGQIDKAVIAYTEALRLRPGLPSAATNLLLLVEREKQMEHAADPIKETAEKPSDQK